MSTIAQKLDALSQDKTNINTAIQNLDDSLTYDQNNLAEYAPTIETFNTSIRAELGEVIGGEVGDICNEPLEPWVRPADWLDTPNPLETEQKIVLLVHLDETWDFCTFYVEGAYTVDWGDGVVENFNSGTTAIHTYDLTTISDDTLTDDGMKQVIVTIAPQDGNDITNVRTDSKNKGLKTKIIEAKCSVPKVDSGYMFYNQFYIQNIEFFYNFNSNNVTCYMFAYCYSLQHIKGFNNNIESNCDGMFRATASLKVIENTNIVSNSSSTMFNTSSNPDFINTNISITGNMYYCFEYSLLDLSKINITNTTNLYKAFHYHKGGFYGKNMVSFDVSACTYMYDTFWVSSFIKVDFIGACIGPHKYLFEANTEIQEVINLDLSNSTDNLYMFTNSPNLTKATILNINKSIDIKYTALPRDQLVGILNNLVDLTDQDAQTCTLTGCAGVADLTDDDKAIATNKNWNLVL